MPPQSAPPAARPSRALRDVRDVEAYVSDRLAHLGVRPTSHMHTPLLAQGVRSAYRLERALPPETSLAAVLDDVLPARLLRELRGWAPAYAA